MPPTTRELWETQNRHPGDRRRLFDAVASVIDPERVLYPGSYVDIAASFVFDDVTYVDIDRRAARFFGDADEVAALIAEQRGEGGRDGARPRVRFVHADYREPLDLDEHSVDLLVSLYAGPISEYCTRHLRVGGSLLANPSHGDVALAALDDRYELAGVVQHRDQRYRVITDGLDDHLIPKRPDPVTRESVLESGRGVAYTKPSFAYLFTRIA